MNNKWYACDFETAADDISVKNKETYVWAWGLTKIYQIDDTFYYGTTIDGFIAQTLELGGGTFWFHNEKFDGSFIISFLLNNGFTFTNSKVLDMEDWSFNVLCNNMGQIYRIIYKVSGNNGPIVCKIQNSLLKIPGSIRSIAKSLNLDITKGEIDYSAFRAEGADDLDLTDKEYLERDVRILAKAMYKMHMSNNHSGLTIGSDCLKAYKKLNKNYNELFPDIGYDIDSYIRQSYRGGYVWCKNKNVRVDMGATFDKNSMYPYVMHSSSKYLFPYGEPVYFEGEYKEDKQYPIYVQRIRVTAELKPERWPTINLGCAYSSTGHSEYNNFIDSQELVLTDVDLLWLFKNYDILDYEDIDGYKFKATKGMFDDYINTYMKMKKDATISADPVKRQLAKLMLNNLYGKFGTNPIKRSKIPVLVDGVIKWMNEQDYWMMEYYKQDKVCIKKFNEYKSSGYIPVATFCTAYARNELWRAMDIVWEHFLYCDTDSIHILFNGIKLALDKLKIDDTELGAWALESIWNQGIFIRAKTYAEQQFGKFKTDAYGDTIFKTVTDVNADFDTLELNWDIKCAGMPGQVKEQIDIEDFKVGHTWVSEKYLSTLNEKERNNFIKFNGDKLHILKYEGKLMPKQVKGGTILYEVPFKIVP